MKVFGLIICLSSLLSATSFAQSPTSSQIATSVVSSLTSSAGPAYDSDCVVSLSSDGEQTMSSSLSQLTLKSQMSAPLACGDAPNFVPGDVVELTRRNYKATITYGPANSRVILVDGRVEGLSVSTPTPITVTNANTVSGTIYLTDRKGNKTSTIFVNVGYLNESCGTPSSGTVVTTAVAGEYKTETLTFDPAECDRGYLNGQAVPLNWAL